MIWKTYDSVTVAHSFFPLMEE